MSSIITKITLEEMMRSYQGLDRQAVTELKDWNATQLHLPRLSEADLALFYLNNAYDIKATKRNISEYFVMRHHAPELFATRKDLQSDVMNVFDHVFIFELPGRTKDSQKVVLARLFETDASRYNFASAAKALNMVLDSGVWEYGPDNKYLLIFDISGSKTEHRATLNWMTLKKFYDYLHRGSPVRWIGAHYVNSAGAATSADFQEFVKRAIVNNADLVDGQMVHYHETIAAMCDATGIERAMLPREMGGEAGTAMNLQKAQVKKLESQYAFLAGMENRVKLTVTRGIPTVVEVFGPEKDF